MKHTKRILLYLCVALFLTTGVTFSRYIASSDGGDAARVAKFGELSLYETEFGVYYAPGAAITKNPMVDFESNELAAYVFVKVDAEDWSFDVENNRFSAFDDKPEPAEILTWSVDTNEWTALSSGNEIVYYIYVPAGTALREVPIITDHTIQVSENITNSEMKELETTIGNVTFTSYAVQANGFENAAAAWERVSER